MAPNVCFVRLQKFNMVRFVKFNLVRLRKARENWSQVFPLTGQLWLDWVADEQKIAATEEEKSKVRSKKRRF